MTGKLTPAMKASVAILIGLAIPVVFVAGVVVYGWLLEHSGGDVDVAFPNEPAVLLTGRDAIPRGVDLIIALRRDGKLSAALIPLVDGVPGEPIDFVSGRPSVTPDGRYLLVADTTGTDVIRLEDLIVVALSIDQQVGKARSSCPQTSIPDCRSAPAPQRRPGRA